MSNFPHALSQWLVRTLAYRFAFYLVSTAILAAGIGDTGAHPKQLLEAALAIPNLEHPGLSIDFARERAGLRVDYWLLAIFFIALIDLSLAWHQYSSGCGWTSSQPYTPRLHRKLKQRLIP